MTVIRAYTIEDAPDVRTCFIALQDHEHALAPTAPTGAAIATAYLAWMHERIDRYDGRLFVAEVDGAVVGFVSVLLDMPSDPDDRHARHAFISEVSVLPAHRGAGIGRALIDRAIAAATEAGAPSVRLMVITENSAAKRLYTNMGFTSEAELMELRL